ncbi:lactonase family protein [Amaricoccus solimangrovi]|uniref:Lactonase family protein n=1 Tax=Amaricoccus solimangrovi TaxID=2589815 RepID=A0A501WC22_9RHOB|nr:beta-propeller fold lactonase family protein [Amaricoccus solimangrovi]TPE47483.1 lactonase family protein [Amaricoccus solimangrovi]
MGISQPLLCVGNRRKGPSSWEKASPGRHGLDIHRFDPDTGELEPIGAAAGEVSVGAITWDAERHLLYVVHEALTLPGHHLGGGGQVIAFHLDMDSGGISEASRQPSFGTLPAYTALSAEGDYLLLANHTGHTPVTRAERGDDGRFRVVLDYDEAATVLFPLDGAGAIEPPSDLFRHEGHGALPAQTHPQLHSVVRAPDRDLFVVCDKGADRLHLFGIDRAAGALERKASLPAPPGSSPRYCVFHPARPLLYVNFETAPILHLYRVGDDALDLVQETRLPEHAEGMQSDLILHPDGRFLYTLVRGAEVVAIHAVAEDGTLRPLATQPLGVGNARGAAISPDGRHFLVAAVTSREVRVFPLGADGLLRGEGRSYPHPAPGCLTFAVAANTGKGGASGV